MRITIVLALLMLMPVLGCNEAVETTEKGGSNAVGIAEKMSGGTLGDTDTETGDSAEESAEAGSETETEEGGGE